MKTCDEYGKLGTAEAEAEGAEKAEHLWLDLARLFAYQTKTLRRIFDHSHVAGDMSFVVN